MSYEAIARRWARAIFELGKETKTVARLNEDIGAFAALYSSNEELSAVLENPLVPDTARENVLVEIAAKMGLSDTAKSTLRLLAQKRRVAALPLIARQLARLADEDGNVLRAEVTTAAPVGEDYLGKLRAELEKATGKKVSISHKVDKALIGGVVTRIGDRVIDGSVKTRLTNFRETLLRA
ncbi:ATP synthase delta chain [Minicystis rosea]|nr:ATP synthase delta chain [Minicystis rosea]